jgi:hypothetical protein
MSQAFQKFNTQQAFCFTLSNTSSFSPYIYCTFEKSLNVSKIFDEIIIRECFKSFLTEFRDFFLKSEKRKQELNVFVITGSPGMGKSVFGIILVLFIANAISVSHSNNKEIDKSKYSEIFPEFDLKCTEEKNKGYVIVLYHHKKLFTRGFVVKFDFSDRNWKCVYEGENPNTYKISQHFKRYKCFFMFDSIDFMSKIDFFYFDGVVISIDSPESVVPLRKLNSFNSGTNKYFYCPLWDDFEFESFLRHFGFPNFFDFSGSDINPGFVSKMGLDGLSKTDVFGNNPRILSRPDIVKDFLMNLTTALKSSTFTTFITKFTATDVLDQNVDIAIHRLFFMKPIHNYCDFNIIPVSEYVLCLINRYVSYINISDASNNFQNSIHPVLRGINFETYFHTYISKTVKGCTINITSKYELKGTKFELEKSYQKKSFSFTILKYNRFDNITSSDLVEGGYYCPRAFNFPTFDSVFKGEADTENGKENVILFFQCTVKDKRDINEKGYWIIENCLDGVNHVSLIFIVPNANFPFTPYWSSLSNFDSRISIYLGSFPI